MANKNYILSAQQANKKIQRLALEIAEQWQNNTTEIILIGIKQSGLVIAQKIAQAATEYLQANIKIIDASLNKAMPEEVVYSEQINFTNKHIIVCDDVANSGKTLLYALKPLLNYHPASIQTLVLVERMHKLFPIKPDYVGLSIATTLQDHIVVEIENDEIVGAYLQ